MLDGMKAVWRHWKAFAHALIRAQNWFLMALVYWLAVGPVAVIYKLMRPDSTDRGLGDPAAQSHWLTPLMGDEDIRRAQRPW